MAIPIDFYVATNPVDTPQNTQELLNLIAASLGSQITHPAKSNYIFGQMGGILPQTNVGPWANGTEWWFWDYAQGAYARSSEGVPIGTIMMWGGTANPANWLICDGREIDRVDYASLFKVIGGSWGGGDGETTFNLPPGGKFYLADSGFVANPLVPVDPNSPSGAGGWGFRGGAQVAPLIAANNMPALVVKVPFVNRDKATGVDGVSAVEPPGTGESWVFQILDSTGQQLQGQDQTQISIMPPFAAANYIIKYQ